METKFLIITSHGRIVGPMAAGWLQSFDEEFRVQSAALAPAEAIDPMAISVMQVEKIDIQSFKPTPLTSFQAQNWDYVLLINLDEEADLPTFSGNVLHRMTFHFDALDALHAKSVTTETAYQVLRDQIRYQLFDFYLRDLCGQEMLGADSCGVWCDLP